MKDKIKSFIALIIFLASRFGCYAVTQSKDIALDLHQAHSYQGSMPEELSGANFVIHK